jgi:hypothetical protein
MWVLCADLAPVLHHCHASLSCTAVLQEAPADSMLRSLRSAPQPHILRLPAPLVSQLLQEHTPEPKPTAAQDDDDEVIEVRSGADALCFCLRAGLSTGACACGQCQRQTETSNMLCLTPLRLCAHCHPSSAARS